MPARPITRDRITAAVKRRVRKAQRKLESRRASTPRSTGRMAGLVEEFSTTRISGWVAVPPEHPPVRVSLRVGDLEIAAAWAFDVLKDRNNWGETRGFYLRVRDIWKFTRKSDQVTVRVDGKSLPINGHGMYLTPPRKGERTLTDLKAKLADGYVFGQTGGLQLSKKLDTQWQATVMGLYQRVSTVVNEHYGYEPFFVYGTLLGAVREGGVIGHDLDFDAAYLSKHREGREAADELRDIAFLLVENGLDVECMRSALHIHDPDDPDARIDLFHLYFDEDGKVAFPFGVAGTTDITVQDWQGTREMQFCGHTGLVPKNAEQFAEHIYGAGWATPKPGFDWDRERTKRAWPGVLPFVYKQEVFWENFYARHRFDVASAFSAALLERDDLPTTVLDLGCGDGRDAVAFAEAGCTVLGLDRSPRAVALAAARAVPGAEFDVCDFTDGDALGERLKAVLAGTDGPALFFLRFLLSAIGKDVAESVMGALNACARPGDLFAAEFRTDLDEALPKAFGKHFRRYVPGPAFGAELAGHGWELISEVTGTGLAVHDDEDPEVYRVVARRG